MKQPRTFLKTFNNYRFMANSTNKGAKVIKDNQGAKVAPVATVLTAEKFSITETGTYEYNGTVINVSDITRDSGRKIHISGTIDGETFKSDIMGLKSRFGIATKVYNTTGTGTSCKVLTDEEITKKVATFAGNIANCINALTKVCNGVATFKVNFYDNDNNETTTEDITLAYRSALLATNEENKRKIAEADAKRKEREEMKTREATAEDIKALLLTGNIAEAMQILQAMQN